MERNASISQFCSSKAETIMSILDLLSASNIRGALYVSAEEVTHSRPKLKVTSKC